MKVVKEPRDKSYRTPDRQKSHRVLVISDTHFPFHHPNTFDFLRDQYKRWSCDTVVHIGDEIDFHAMSQWDTESDALGPLDEFKEGLKAMKVLYKLFPEARVCISNHTARPFRKASKAGIPKVFLRDYSEWMEAPTGWTWDYSFEIDGVDYRHGMETSGKDGAINLAITQMQSTVIGHLHSWGNVKYHTSIGGTIFGLNSGCLVDLDTYAFRYAKSYKSKPTIGCGIVLSDREAYFVPMV